VAVVGIIRIIPIKVMPDIMVAAVKKITVVGVAPRTNQAVTPVVKVGAVRKGKIQAIKTTVESSKITLAGSQK